MSQVSLFGPLGVDYRNSPLVEIVDSQKRISFTAAVESDPEATARKALVTPKGAAEPEAAETLGGDALSAVIHLASVGTIEEREGATIALKRHILASASVPADASVADQQSLIDALVAVLRGGSDRARLDAALCLKRLGKGATTKKMMVSTPGLVEALVTMARLDGALERAEAVACLANLATTDETRAAIGAVDGSLRVIASVLKEGTDAGRLYAAGALGNLAWQSPANAVAIGGLPNVIGCLARLLQESNEKLVV